jgi:hypothetical protein
MSTLPSLIEVMLQPKTNGMGKKCYAIANVTKQIGEFPNAEYFTNERLRYVGLYTRNENIRDGFRWYFQNPMTQEENFVENKSPIAQMNTPVSNPQPLIGFVEVMCHANKIRSLLDSSRTSFQNYVNTQSDNDKRDIVDSLKKHDIYEIVDPSFKLSSKGGRRRKKTIRKRPKRKSRKNRRKSKRR